MTRALVLGAGGQLGQEILRMAPADVTLKGVYRTECDITDEGAVMRCVETFEPDIIINAAAYTAVDRAESDRDRAFAVNAAGAKNVAQAALACDALLAHISTDYVFDGRNSTPYRPDAHTNPLGIYGASKADGERAILDSGGNSLVIRTSWLYASKGQNFLHTMLRLMKTNPIVRVVNDQIGSPSASRDLAGAVWKCLRIPAARGILHWTNTGVASWYDFAVAIQELAVSKSLLRGETRIVPISTRDYPLPARRPAFSILDSSKTWSLLGGEADPWRTALGRTLDELRATA